MLTNERCTPFNLVNQLQNLKTGEKKETKKCSILSLSLTKFLLTYFQL